MNDKINKKLVNAILILIFLILLIFFLQYTSLLAKIKEIVVALIPFYIGFFLSWLLTPIAQFFNKKLKINLKIANALSLILSIILLLIFIFVILPLALLQAADLVKTLPQIWNSFLERLPDSNFLSQNQIDKILNYFDISPDKILVYIKNYLSVIAGSISFLIAQVYGLFVFVTQIVFGYIVAFYFMGSIRGFVKGIINLVEIGDKEENAKLLVDMSKSLFSYVRGLFIVTCMVGFMITVGAYIIGIDSPLVFGLISAITDVIPYLGPVLGGIPLFIVALAMGYKQAILVIVLICFVQFVENNFFQPKIMSQATSLHPVTILIGLLVFGSIFGIIGMVIATPILSMFNVWLKQSRFKDKISI